MITRKGWLVAMLVASTLVTSAANAGEDPPLPQPQEESAQPPQSPAQEDAPPAQAPAAKAKWDTPVGFRVDGGYSPRRLLTIPLAGADLGLAFGAQPMEHAAFWGASRLFLGSTENGLHVFSVRVGAEGEAVFDRFRIGGGLSGFVVGVGRAVRNDTIYSWGPALNAAARFDVIQSDSFALFARAAIDGGLDVYQGSIFWGPSIGAGIDLDLAGKRAR